MAWSVLVVFGTSGCRENPPVSPPTVTPSSTLHWSVGDRMIFDTWALDSNGYSISSSKCVSVRKVINSSQVYQGREGVIVMVDSIAIPGRALRLDTAYFSQTSTGDLWEFGLLSSARTTIQRGTGRARVGPDCAALGQLHCVDSRLCRYNGAGIGKHHNGKHILFSGHSRRQLRVSGTADRSLESLCRLFLLDRHISSGVCSDC